MQEKRWKKRLYINSKKGAKKGVGVICRKTPLAIPSFLYDWGSSWFSHALNELTCPVSEVWD